MGNSARALDVLDTRPAFTAADVAALNARFAGQATTEMLRAVLNEGLLGRAAIVSSFGAESAVLLHLVAQIQPHIPVLFLDTGKHFPETLAYRDELVASLGLTNLRNLRPDETALAAKDATGLRWSYDPDGCCALRKVAPLERALEGYDATITGRKGFQSTARAGLPLFEPDGGSGRVKFNPLHDWSADDIRDYAQAHALAAHPLVVQGYPSIGCAPCTSKVMPGEDPRAG
ncbi:MAG: phosphoadenylyl-sulfate reductase, partial [Alphaproteobacteria bacterium]|nr:phosphoadenylyl-sulfate reductase [Alphaproteobacteria bacterium]